MAKNSEPTDPRDAVVETPMTQMDIMLRLVGSIEKLANSNAAGSAEAIQSLTAAVERISEGQIEAGKNAAQAFRKGQRPSNDIGPSISAFNLRGDKDFPRPTLKCEFLIPWPAEPESLTREEIQLLNLIEPGEYMVKKNDGTRMKVMVRATYNLDGTKPSRILINHDTAFNNDNHRQLMPLPDMLRQMLNHDLNTRKLAKSILTMDEEEALIMAGQLNDGSESPLVVSQGE